MLLDKLLSMPIYPLGLSMLLGFTGLLLWACAQGDALGGRLDWEVDGPSDAETIAQFLGDLGTSGGYHAGRAKP